MHHLTELHLALLLLKGLPSGFVIKNIQGFVWVKYCDHQIRDIRTTIYGRKSPLAAAVNIANRMWEQGRALEANILVLHSIR